MLKSLFNKVTASTRDPKQMRLKQHLLLGSVVGVGLLVYYFVQGGAAPSVDPKTPPNKEPVAITTPLDAINPQDVWAGRIQKEAEEAKSEAKAVREENQLLAKKMEIMEKILQGSSAVGQGKLDSSGSQSFAPPLLEDAPFKDDLPKMESQSLMPPVGDPLSSDRSHKNLAKTSISQNSEDDKLFGTSASSKFLQLSLSDEDRHILKNIDNYVPAGSYARAVLTSGVVASTALETSSQPQPIVMRLVDEGHLPRGFKGTLNQNVLIGACYGDLSAERVMCRLETMAWVEQNGTTVEKKVEGWIIGEDGRPGMRGEVVDRSGDAVRDTMIAGMLSGLGQFLKSESTSSVYPVSPFGQTNALSGGRALSGAASTGASNALDKLAEFSIKRAEQMQPVILIASGRVVDVVFKTGVDIRPEVAAPSLTLIDQKQKPKEQTHESF
ncbi:MAG: TraB/VirB10 family protein [Janthinobacterium lividum]